MGYTKFLISLLLFAAVTCEAQTAPLPQIRQNGAVKQFFVDDKPYIMLAGELHNSSASSVEYMQPIWDKLAALHLNTVIGTASWELVEPKEGKFDFSLVDDQINQARQRNMRLVLSGSQPGRTRVRAILRIGSGQTQNASHPWSSRCGPMAE